MLAMRIRLVLSRFDAGERSSGAEFPIPQLQPAVDTPVALHWQLAAQHLGGDPRLFGGTRLLRGVSVGRLGPPGRRSAHEQPGGDRDSRVPAAVARHPAALRHLDWNGKV